MFRRGKQALSTALDVDIGEIRPNLAGIRATTYLGLAVGFLDVVTTAEHLLVPPMVDGNPLLIALGQLSPSLAYGAFVCWFFLVAGVAIVRDDALGYGADTYLFLAFGLAGVANAAYLLFGMTLFKTLVGQYPAMLNVYQFLVAPLGSLVVGYCVARWASRARRHSPSTGWYRRDSRQRSEREVGAATEQLNERSE